MNAMQMMLNQLGLNPEELKQNAENIGKLVASIDTRMQNIEAQNALIIEKLNSLLPSSDTPSETLKG